METRALVIGEYQVGRISGKVEVPLAFGLRSNRATAAHGVCRLDLSWLSGLAARSYFRPDPIIDRRGTFLVRHPDPMEDRQDHGGHAYHQKGAEQEEGTAEAVGVDGNLR
jgi:hypothetical protein